MDDRFLIVEMRNWLSGRKVRLSPFWMTRVDKADYTVSVYLSRESVQKSPVFDASQPVSMTDETPSTTTTDVQDLIEENREQDPRRCDQHCVKDQG